MSTAEVTVQTEYRHIIRTPAVVGGEPRIAGHRIRVRDIVAARDLGGYTPEEIATGVYPQLTLAQVYAALAYYEDHRAEIGRAVDNEVRSVAQVCPALFGTDRSRWHDCQRVLNRAESLC